MIVSEPEISAGVTSPTQPPTLDQMSTSATGAGYAGRTAYSKARAEGRTSEEAIEEAIEAQEKARKVSAQKLPRGVQRTIEAEPPAPVAKPAPERPTGVGPEKLPRGVERAIKRTKPEPKDIEKEVPKPMAKPVQELTHPELPRGVERAIEREKKVEEGVTKRERTAGPIWDLPAERLDKEQLSYLYKKGELNKEQFEKLKGTTSGLPIWKQYEAYKKLKDKGLGRLSEKEFYDVKSMFPDQETFKITYGDWETASTLEKYKEKDLLKKTSKGTFVLNMEKFQKTPWKDIRELNRKTAFDISREDWKKQQYLRIAEEFDLVEVSEKGGIRPTKSPSAYTETEQKVLEGLGMEWEESVPRRIFELGFPGSEALGMFLGTVEKPYRGIAGLLPGKTPYLETSVPFGFSEGYETADIEGIAGYGAAAGEFGGQYIGAYPIGAGAGAVSDFVLSGVGVASKTAPSITAASGRAPTATSALETLIGGGKTVTGAIAAHPTIAKTALGAIVVAPTAVRGYAQLKSGEEPTTVAAEMAGGIGALAGMWRGFEAGMQRNPLKIRRVAPGEESAYTGIVWERGSKVRPLFGKTPEGWSIGKPSLKPSTIRRVFGGTGEWMPETPTEAYFSRQAGEVLWGKKSPSLGLARKQPWLRRKFRGSYKRGKASLDDLPTQEPFKYRNTLSKPMKTHDDVMNLLKSKYSGKLDVYGSMPERAQMLRATRGYLTKEISMSSDDIANVMDDIARGNFSSADDILRQYGSSIDDLERTTGLKNWPIRDFDIQYSNPSQLADDIVRRINKIEGEGTAWSPKGSGTVNIKTPEGGVRHLFDIHKPGASGYSLGGNKYLTWGLRGGKRIKAPSPFEGTRGFWEQATRRTTHGPMKFFPSGIRPHYIGRVKDIVRGPAVQRAEATLIELERGTGRLMSLRKPITQIESLWRARLAEMGPRWEKAYQALQSQAALPQTGGISLVSPPSTISTSSLLSGIPSISLSTIEAPSIPSTSVLSSTPSITTPSVSPSVPPSVPPSVAPSVTPSVPPSISPSVPPSISPSLAPSVPPSTSPSVTPSPVSSTQLSLTSKVPSYRSSVKSQVSVYPSSAVSSYIFSYALPSSGTKGGTAIFREEEKLEEEKKKKKKRKVYRERIFRVGYPFGGPLSEEVKRKRKEDLKKKRERKKSKKAKKRTGVFGGKSLTESLKEKSKKTKKKKPEKRSKSLTEQLSEGSIFNRRKK